MVLPGPDEVKARQLQEYLIIIVDDLLKLWEVGLRVPDATGECGLCDFAARAEANLTCIDRLIRVAVALVICDHPALCKFFVYGEKNHGRSPCHRCKVTTKEYSSKESLTNGSV